MRRVRGCAVHAGKEGMNDYDRKKLASEYFDTHRHEPGMTVRKVAELFGLRLESLRNWRCNHRSTRNRP